MKLWNHEIIANLTKTNCKPCITIRENIKLLYWAFWTNAWETYRKEKESMKLVNQAVCVLPNVPPTKSQSVVDEIRKLAKDNYKEEFTA